MLDNLTEENIARWRQQIDMDYQESSEREKERDRAQKAIEVTGISAVFFRIKLHKRTTCREAAPITKTPPNVFTKDKTIVGMCLSSHSYSTRTPRQTRGKTPQYLKIRSRLLVL